MFGSNRRGSSGLRLFDAGCTKSFMANYRVVVRQSEEEALANIQVAIREYVEAAEELQRP
jgi:hypothetical protein